MPVSQKQLAANRANAKKSTGPRTAQGKARVSRNALTHGLAARRPIVLPHQEHEFNALSQSLRAEIQPWGALELEAFEQLLHAAWQLRRSDTFESATFSPDASPDVQLLHLERLTRLRGAIERSYQRAYRRLRELQTVRSTESTRPLPAAFSHAATAPLAPCPKEKNQTHSFPESLCDQYLELCKNPATYTHLPFRALFHLHGILSRHPRFARKEAASK